MKTLKDILTESQVTESLFTENSFHEGYTLGRNSIEIIVDDKLCIPVMIASYGRLEWRLNYIVAHESSKKDQYDLYVVPTSDWSDFRAGYLLPNLEADHIVPAKLFDFNDPKSLKNDYWRSFLYDIHDDSDHWKFSKGQKLELKK